MQTLSSLASRGYQRQCIKSVRGREGPKRFAGRPVFKAPEVPYVSIWVLLSVLRSTRSACRPNYSDTPKRHYADTIPIYGPSRFSGLLLDSELPFSGWPCTFGCSCFRSCIVPLDPSDRVVGCSRCCSKRAPLGASCLMAGVSRWSSWRAPFGDSDLLTGSSRRFSCGLASGVCVSREEDSVRLGASFACRRGRSVGCCCF